MKKFLILTMIFTLFFTTSVYASDQYEGYAANLKEIGVFNGTNSGFELDRAPTRVEAASMFVRLLGAEQAALTQKYTHPFKDVPKWADAYVGYLYHEKLTNGVGATTFGSTDKISAGSYFTFVLRALGYSDSKGDFAWNKALEFGKEKGLLGDSDYGALTANTFLRGHVAMVSYQALKLPMKDSATTLAEQLVAAKAIDEAKAVSIGVIEDHMNYPLIDTSKDQLIRIEADPSKGFNYPFYLYVPKGAAQSNIDYMLVEPNNTGECSDDISVHDASAKTMIESGVPGTIANDLAVPALVPVFPRPAGDNWLVYTHALDRDTLQVKDGPMKRIDLQLISMIDYAQKVLVKNGLQVDKKVFMDGFSASGNFVNRFVALHPDRVKAAATGGVNCMPILPAASYNGKALPYPVGIGDLKALTGTAFNLDEYKKVAQYIYMGYLDENDTLAYWDSYDPSERELPLNVLGGDMHKRWSKSIEIIQAAGASPQFVMYNNTGHEIKKEMLNDLVDFFNSNSGPEIKQINPMGYPFVERRAEIHEITISKVLTGKSPETDPWFASMAGAHDAYLATELKVVTPGDEGSAKAEQQRNDMTLFAMKAGKLYLVDSNGNRIDSVSVSGTASCVMGVGKDTGMYFIMSGLSSVSKTPGTYKIVAENLRDDYQWIINADLVIE